MRCINQPFCILTALFMLIGLSCGGGGDLVAGGGIGGTGVISVGEVTEIGSIWVNGVEYDTGQADVYLGSTYIGSGDQTIIENVDVGRIVHVRGRLHDTDSGTADEVYFSSAVLAPIDMIEPIDDFDTKLTILDQTVIVNERTLFKNTVLDDLAVGDIVDVAGHFDDTGVIFASFLEITSATPYTVSGPISNLDTGNTTFTINDLVVDYSLAEADGAIPAAVENGMVVSANGRIETDGIVLMADRVDTYLNVEKIQGEAIEIEGFIGAALQDDQFLLNGFTVEINTNTEFINGTEEEILLGIIVEVEGYFNNGIIIAQKVKLSALFRAESDLGRKDSGNRTLEMKELEAITFQTNELTRYLGRADSFEALTPDDHLVIKGRMVEDQIVTAVQIIGRPTVQDKLVLRGTVTAINAPILTINGVSVDTDTIPPNGFYTNEDTSVSQDDFFQLLQEDDWVEARGELSVGPAVWEKITLGLTQ